MAQETSKIKIAHSPISIDINTGLYTKIRGKIEYRFKKNNALLFSYSSCYGQLNPGAQIYLEYRNYYNKKDKTEHFFYGKVGLGKSFTYNGNYALLGIGLGQKISFSKKQSFFIQFSEGVKFCPKISGNIEAASGSGLAGLFYIIGPGAVVDLNINFGYRF